MCKCIILCILQNTNLISLGLTPHIIYTVYIEAHQLLIIGLTVSWQHYIFGRCFEQKLCSSVAAGQRPQL